MEENRNTVTFEKVLDNELDDLWSIFFSQTGEKKKKTQLDQQKKTKPRRYLKLLTI